VKTKVKTYSSTVSKSLISQSYGFNTQCKPTADLGIEGNAARRNGFATTPDGFHRASKID